MEKELDRLGFTYEYKDGKFKCTIPPRRLDVDPRVNDIAEEIGKLYGYHNLVSTLPNCKTKQGKYVGDVLIRKTISKRLRALGLNEVKTYTLTSEEMAKKFKYEDKKNKYLPNPMSSDKSVIRTSILPSLMNTYAYNKKRHVDDINIYEIAKTYDVNYEEDTKIAMLMSGCYVQNSWNNNNVKANFYLVKGIIENLLDFLGFKNRYSYEVLENDDFHPGMSAKVLIDREVVGVFGRVHPMTNKDEIYYICRNCNYCRICFRNVCWICNFARNNLDDVWNDVPNDRQNFNKLQLEIWWNRTNFNKYMYNWSNNLYNFKRASKHTFSTYETQST